MREDIFAFIFGIFFGVWAVIILLFSIPNSSINRLDKLINECEATLPRNQQCVLVALPKDTN